MSLVHRRGGALPAGYRTVYVMFFPEAQGISPRLRGLRVEVARTLPPPPGRADREGFLADDEGHGSVKQARD